jgi:hypothetical protein
MIKLKLKTYKEISNFLKDEKHYFFHLIVNSIKEGWKDKLEVVEVIEFYVNENCIKVDVDEKDWNNTLHLALYYYEGIEDYENCVVVSDLIIDIYGQVNHE